jgi:uncharacterized protein
VSFPSSRRERPAGTWSSQAHYFSTQGAGYQQLFQQVRPNEIIHGKLLSNDGMLTLMVLALDPDVVKSQ